MKMNINDDLFYRRPRSEIHGTDSLFHVFIVLLDYEASILIFFSSSRVQVDLNPQLDLIAIFVRFKIYMFVFF